MTSSLADRVASLEQKHPDDQEYLIQCILSRMPDNQVDLLDDASRMTDRGMTLEEIENAMTDAGKFDLFSEVYDSFNQIQADLRERAKRGDLPGIIIAGREVWPAFKK
jgi:hypothetical protein